MTVCLLLGDEVISHEGFAFMDGTSAVVKGESAPAVLPCNVSPVRTW